MTSSLNGTLRAVTACALLACLPMLVGCRSPHASTACSAFSCGESAQMIPEEAQAAAQDKLQQANHELELPTEAIQ